MTASTYGRFISKLGVLAAGAVLVLQASTAQGQHGHPLAGSWSGTLTGPDAGIRVLLALDFGVDQRVVGFVIADGNRYPLTAATLDHDRWQVSLLAEGQDESGEVVRYELQGELENLGSPERAIVGAWQQGDRGGEFRVVRNN